MSIDGYDVHPAADVFPMLDDAALREIADDIHEHGLRDSIVRIWVDGKPLILDGRNRFRACQIANVNPQFIDYDGDDPVGFVVSKNLKRRHLTPTERALAASAIANLAHGGDQKSKRSAAFRSESITVDEAAKLVGASPRTVTNVRAAQRDGVPELVDAMKTGKVGAETAAMVAKKAPEEQREILRKVESGEAKNVREAMGEAPRPKARASKVEPEAIDDDVPDEDEDDASPARRADAVEREEAVAKLVEEGLGTSDIAKALGMKPGSVSKVRSRLGLVRKRKTRATAFAVRAMETSEDLDRAFRYHDSYFHDSTPAELQELIESLRALAVSTKRLIKRLNKEANGVSGHVEESQYEHENRESQGLGSQGGSGVPAGH